MLNFLRRPTVPPVELTEGQKAEKAFMKRFPNYFKLGDIEGSKQLVAFVDGYLCGRAKQTYPGCAGHFSYLNATSSNDAMRDNFYRGYIEGIASSGD